MDHELQSLRVVEKRNKVCTSAFRRELVHRGLAPITTLTHRRGPIAKPEKNSVEFPLLNSHLNFSRNGDQITHVYLSISFVYKVALEYNLRLFTT